MSDLTKKLRDTERALKLERETVQRISRQRDSMAAEMERLRDQYEDYKSKMNSGWFEMEQERDQLKAQINAMKGSFYDLVGDSSGVAGLHLNGDVAPWDDLMSGGRFESWLMAFDGAPWQCLAARDAAAIERILSDDKVREAMQLVWNDHTSDTGCFPGDFSIDADGLLYFTAGHYFADRIAEQLRQQAKESSHE